MAQEQNTKKRYSKEHLSYPFLRSFQFLPYSASPQVTTVISFLCISVHKKRTRYIYFLCLFLFFIQKVEQYPVSAMIK